ncbi:MAG: hypothetical protein ACYC7D_14140 [Nitrososphaerales archaeon]
MTSLIFENSSALHYFLNDSFAAPNIPPPLHVFVVFSKINIDELPKLALGRDRKFSFERNSDGFYNVQFKIKKRGGKGWLITKQDVWIFYFQSEEGSYIGAVVEDWIRGLFPYLSFGLITPTNIYEVLDSLTKTYGTNLELIDYVSRNKKDTQKNWERQPYNRSYLERRVRDDEKVLDTVSLMLADKEDSFEASLSKNGHLTYYSGGKRGFSNFFRVVMQTYIEKSIEHLKSLSKMEAEVSSKDENIVHPIQFIATDGGLTLAHFDKLTAALKAQSDYSISVIHKGNPWLYLSIVDRADGSNSNLYGFDDRIDLVPLLKTSPESLARFEDLIYEVLPNQIRFTKRD